MSKEINIPELVTSTPYEDQEHPSIRFNVKESDDVTKHLLFYKTDKEKSFSEGHLINYRSANKNPSVGIWWVF